MYFSKFEFFMNVNDCDKMHKMLTGMFASDRQSGNILYREVQSGSKKVVYTYSNNPITGTVPRGVRIVFQKDISGTIDEIASVGNTINLDFVTMPYKRCADENDKKSYGKKRRLKEASDRKAWIANKGDSFGFKVVGDTLERNANPIKGNHRHGKMVFNPFQYTIKVEVTDSEKFHRLLNEGIGAGKSYGMGMVLFKG